MNIDQLDSYHLLSTENDKDNTCNTNQKSELQQAIEEFQNALEQNDQDEILSTEEIMNAVAQIVRNELASGNTDKQDILEKAMTVAAQMLAALLSEAESTQSSSNVSSGTNSATESQASSVSGAGNPTNPNQNFQELLEIIRNETLKLISKLSEEIDPQLANSHQNQATHFFMNRPDSL